MYGIWFLDHRSKLLSPRFKIKHGSNGSAEKFKARFVACEEGIVYDDTLAPVARYTTIRSIITLAAMQGWSLHQMDVRTTFCMM